MKVVVFCGKIGAGKSTAARHVSSRFGIPILSFTAAVFNPILRVLGVEPSRVAFQQLGAKLAEWPGERQLLTTLLRSTNEEIAILDDVRYQLTAELVRSATTRSLFIFVESDFRERFSRLRLRDGVDSFEDQYEAERASTEIQIESLRDFADQIVENNSHLNNFLDAVASSVGHFLAGEDAPF